MIANAKSISHGIRAMLYVSGESRNKKHPEKITRVCDNFMRRAWTPRASGRK